MDHLDLRKEIVQTCRRMSTSGLVAGTEGNVSARTAEGNVLITPSGLDYAVMEPEGVVVVSLECEILEGTFQPSTETPMHTEIYRSRPETLGIVHTHARFSTTFACLNWEIPPDWPERRSWAQRVASRRSGSPVAAAEVLARRDRSG